MRPKDKRREREIPRGEKNKEGAKEGARKVNIQTSYENGSL